MYTRLVGDQVIVRLPLSNESAATMGTMESGSISNGSTRIKVMRGMQMSERKLSGPEQIEQRAYELYLERGGENGDDLADWLAAERELTELAERSNSGAPKARAAAASLQPTSSKADRIAQEVLVEYSKN
jgi:Protein of unknown function (DUF2934)